ncbi:zinc metalloprotease [Halococcoides cellulosivorans]|uniref:Uncharacterized protein n=1 Tax=Halococcoides cellulosivorans TaxID=1679096 RepID=A0A2R4X352_9EURY|nr:hypothetical protein [Halococcoides cellulosivorans]AWB28229.1 hypothetical protein HARCEL1_11200 [Halococcoides cellulosivorans]
MTVALVVLMAPAIAGFGASVAVPAAPSDASAPPADSAGAPTQGGGPAPETWSMMPSPADERSAAQAGGSELFADPDDDGLATIVEQRLGTDPHDADTDGDGLPDGAEATCTDALPGADPLHQDLYLEVDSESGESLSDGAIERAEAAFAEAPVSNPDGQSGIDLHVRRDDGDLTLGSPVDTIDRPGSADDIGDVTTAHRDYRTAGHYYVLVADKVAYDGDPEYVGAGQPGVVMFESYPDPFLTASLLVHELGHAFGFDESLPGVDSERYSLDEYPSVMNYNGLYTSLEFSDGSGDLGRDEWAFIADDRHRPPVTCGPNETQTTLDRER